jgi:hypothetical protein
MSERRRRGKRDAARVAPPTKSPSPGRSRNGVPARAIAFGIAGVLVAVAVLALVLLRGEGSGSDAATRIAFPAEKRQPPAAPAFADFAGAESCRGCHADIYGRWTTSTHGRAGGDPADVALLAS